MLNKIINISFLIILMLLQVNYSFADTTITADTGTSYSISDAPGSGVVAPTPRNGKYSCIAGTGLGTSYPLYDTYAGYSDAVNLLINEAKSSFVLYILQLSSFGALEDNFSMLDPKAEGQVQSDGVTMRCDVPTSDIRFCYKAGNTDYADSDCASLSYNPEDLTQENRVTLAGVTFISRVVNDMLCVFFDLSAGSTHITQPWPAGCKTMKDPSTIKIYQSCQVPMSCIDREYQKSRNLYPITGAMVQCFRETIINSVFSSCCASDNTTTKSNMFYNFQSSMRDIVRLLLTLYVIFQGIKIALAGDMPKKHEVMIFGLKFALVVYFSVGFIGPNTTGNYCNQTNRGATDGITNYVLPGMMALTDSLSDIMIGAETVGEMCQFNSSSYDTKYSYLALWDTLDCKMLYYLGAVNRSGAVNILFSIITLVLSLLLSGLFLHAILVILFSLFIMGLIIYIVHFYLLAQFAMILLIYMAPIFVPCALFEKTKSFFQSWSRLILSFALQPVIVVGFVSVMLSVFDNIMYGTCSFSKVTLMSGDLVYDQFQMNSSSISDVNCNTTFGFPILISTGGIKTQPLLGGLVNITTPTSLSFNQLGQLLSLTGFAFLFFTFCSTIGNFAADLTGGAPISAANMIGSLVKKGVSGIKAGGIGAISAVAAPAKQIGSSLARLATRGRGPSGGGE